VGVVVITLMLAASSTGQRHNCIFSPLMLLMLSAALASMQGCIYNKINLTTSSVIYVNISKIPEFSKTKRRRHATRASARRRDTRAAAPTAAA
jgi:hypothetical protein